MACQETCQGLHARDIPSPSRCADHLRTSHTIRQSNRHTVHKARSVEVSNGLPISTYPIMREFGSSLEFSGIVYGGRMVSLLYRLESANPAASAALQPNLSKGTAAELLIGNTPPDFIFLR